MATFGEIVYMVLDLLKQHSDDAYYTEEHILFLAKKMRALLLERKYKGSRNGTFNIMSEENRQQVCLMLETTDMMPGGCSQKWLRSTNVIPELIPGMGEVACTGHDLLPTNVTFIPAERMHYVGYNKWLHNIIYASRSVDGHMYLFSANPKFIFLERVGLTGVFTDPEVAAKLSHKACETGVCDIMNEPFPLESSLVPACVEMVFQELSGARYAPEDKKNDAKDNLSDVALSRTSAPDVARRQPREQEEAQ